MVVDVWRELQLYARVSETEGWYLTPGDSTVSVGLIGLQNSNTTMQTQTNHWQQTKFTKTMQCSAYGQALHAIGKPERNIVCQLQLG